MHRLACILLLLVARPSFGQSMPIVLSTESSGPCAGRVAYYLTLLVDGSAEVRRTAMSPLRVELRAEDIWSTVALSTGACHYTLNVSWTIPAAEGPEGRAIQRYSGTNSSGRPPPLQVLRSTSRGRELEAAAEALETILDFIDENGVANALRGT